MDFLMIQRIMSGRMGLSMIPKAVKPTLVICGSMKKIPKNSILKVLLWECGSLARALHGPWKAPKERWNNLEDRIQKSEVRRGVSVGGGCD